MLFSLDAPSAPKLLGLAVGKAWEAKGGRRKRWRGGKRGKEKHPSGLGKLSPRKSRRTLDEFERG